MQNEAPIRATLLPPPSQAATPWGWARRNLFNSPVNTLLTSAFMNWYNHRVRLVER